MSSLADQLKAAREGLETGDWSNFRPVVAAVKAEEARPGFLGRALGIDPALVVQLVLLVLELVRQLREMRRLG